MILTETMFIAGDSVGVVRYNTNTGLITFSPVKPLSMLQEREWKSIDDLNAAVRGAYSIAQP